MVEIVLAYGVQNKERYILGRKEATKRLEQLQNESRILKKIIDKGGVAAVIDNDALITAYNYSGLSRGQK